MVRLEVKWRSGSQVILLTTTRVATNATRRSAPLGKRAWSAPTVFRVTIFLSVNALLSEADSHLSEAEKGNRTVVLWRYQNASPSFTADELIYTAHGAALSAAFALAAGKK
jgi:hypothetical protein